MTEVDQCESPLSSRERLDVALQPTNSNMGYEDYRYIGDLVISDLRGLILDLGAGDLERFSREAAEDHFTVISLNPYLVRNIARIQVQEGVSFEFGWLSGLPWQQLSIAGLAQELPLKNNSINTIVSQAAVPGYLDPADYEATLSEVSRVLVPGGKAHLFPLVEIEGLPYNHEKFMTALDDSKTRYSQKHIDSSRSLLRHPYDIVSLEKPMLSTHAASIAIGPILGV